MTQLAPTNQNEMLALMQADSSSVAVFLVNGIRLIGRIEGFDQHIVVLRSNTGMLTVYKHAISTMQVDDGHSRPAKPRGLAGENANDGGRGRSTEWATRKRTFQPS